jgi:hypothetical protein
MWINGRRAFRPDAGYYRRSRRLRVERGAGGGRSRGRFGGTVVWIVAAVVALVVLLLLVRTPWW